MWSIHVALDGTGAGQALDEIVGGIAPARRLVDCCQARGWTLACAESLTGGLLAMAVSVVPGSGDVFLGSVVAYHSDAKHELLDVAPGPWCRLRQPCRWLAARPNASGAIWRSVSPVSPGR